MTTAHNTHAALVVLVSCIGIVGCVQEHGAPDLGATVVSDEKGAVIVGSVNWQESTTLPEGTAERQNAMAVAYLSIPAEGTRCTGFLITPDVIMTNQHCIPRASSANGVRAYFHREAGVSQSSDAGVQCSTFLGNDASLDFALLQCAGTPGDTYGVLGLEGASLAHDAQVYVIHQNCDYYTSPSCDPTKKYSPGKITSTGSEFGHNADTLGGSSGSPMFSRDSHTVVGLHHVGLSNDGNGRGSENRAVRMSNILNAISSRYPGLTLGARAPAGAQQPGEPSQGEPSTTDLYEPNDAFQGAVQVQVPFTSDGARIDANDVDHFAFVGGASRTITMTFSHAAGDLDIYVYDAAGVEVARSIGTTDVESVTRDFGSGMFTIRVLGYQGATGGYALTVE